ncbi:uncharacterized protein [Nicotiana tomentosiformis]|uniref:uncharacterized protein n=1 Tax=Nicotiana tomentosiformis TaxID=4098 RepID=UPI00388C3EC4
MDESDKWSLRYSSLHKSNIFKVRRFNDVHTCPEMSRLFLQRYATSSAITKMICNKYANPKIIYTPADIMSDMKQQYGINMSYVKTYRTKEKALELLRGIPRESYSKLSGHLYMINMTNPGSVIMLHKSEDGRFMYVFVAFNASIIEWKYCSPIVVVNGTFLKSSHKGTMLTASTKYSAVEYVADLQAFGERERMCIVSDRHASILRGTSIVYPEVSHCVCIFHLWNNIKKQFKKNHDRLREVFLAMARAYKIEDFNRLMQDMDNIDKRVRPSTDYVYVVMDVEQRRNIVCLQKRECSCKRFQVDEIPCPHAMAVLDYTHIEAPKYCSAYYTNQYFKKTYEVPVNPLPDETTWDLQIEVLDNVVLPPRVTGKSGRPTKSRRKRLYEYLYTETVTCGLCRK